MLLWCYTHKGRVEVMRSKCNERYSYDSYLQLHSCHECRPLDVFFVAIHLMDVLQSIETVAEVSQSGHNVAWR